MGWHPISMERILYQQSSTNKDDLIRTIQQMTTKLDNRKEEFKKMAHYCPTLYDYLKENIYHDN